MIVHFLWGILFCPVWFILLWPLFIAYVQLKVKWKSLRIEQKVVAGIIVVFAWILDVLINWTWGLLLGVTWQATLSQKCGIVRHKENWQAAVAIYLCTYWLDPFESGGHCHG